jgi:hypothetical protein
MNAHRSNGTTPEQLEADIARQRDELADTVDALQAKLDVKTRAKQKAAELKERATTDTGRPRTEVIAGGVGVLALVAGLVVLKARRAH